MAFPILTIGNDSQQRVARFRRRVWLAIGLCLVTRAGDAALHAYSPQQSNTSEYNQ
ncbi:hypothetical protein [Sphingorhabdus sp.]|uniref:hypothetical protein n=1 Tax=Sphingorhabdus sp. TaxID=1902408 RepID=UPI003593B064